MSGEQFNSRRQNQQEDDEESALISVADDAPTNYAATSSTGPENPSLGWEFEKLKTLPTAWALIVVNLIMIGLVFLIPGICEPIPTKEPGYKCAIDPLSSLIYSHALHWTCHLIADQYLKHSHKISRCRGYIEFYINTKNLRRTPFYMVSIGNAVLLMTYTVLHDYCDSASQAGASSNCQDKFLKVDYLRGLITLECMIIACIWVSYIMNVRDFHKQANRPDIYREDFVQMVCPENFRPLSDETEPTAKEVLEKQAELIRCMHQYVTKLNEKMSKLRFSAAGTASNHHRA